MSERKLIAWRSIGIGKSSLITRARPTVQIVILAKQISNISRTTRAQKAETAPVSSLILQVEYMNTDPLKVVE